MRWAMRFYRELIASYIVLLVLLFSIFLILEEEYLTGSLLIVCILAIAHREIWALIRTRKFPIFDERVQKNISMSIRNSYLLLAPIVIIIWSITDRIGTAAGTVGYVVLAVCLGYLGSYIYYDRLQGRVSVRRVSARGNRISGLPRVIIILIAVSLAIFILLMILLWIFISIWGAAPWHLHLL